MSRRERERREQELQDENDNRLVVSRPAHSSGPVMSRRSGRGRESSRAGRARDSHNHYRTSEADRGRADRRGASKRAKDRAARYGTDSYKASSSARWAAAAVQQ